MADDLHTLSAPYALDALTREERELFEQHLATCGRCRSELAGLADAAAGLGFAVEAVEPHAELRARILDAAHAEGPANVVVLPRRRRGQSTLVSSLAAVAALAIVAVGVWKVTHSTSTSTAQRVMSNPASRHIAIAGEGQLVVAPSGVGVLALHLPAPPKGKTYEAWVANPNVHAAGEFDGRTTTLPVRVTHGARVMVTVERSGGVDAPTSKPLFVVRA